MNGQQIAQRKIVSLNNVIQSDTLLYIHKDHLGSAVRLTDTEGAVVQSLAYDPFGFTVYSGGVSEPTNQYTGQKKDGSGLYYYGARYYDPELGRFISPDTVLDGLNRYAYCGNNPINYVDPTGNGWVPNGDPGPFPFTWVPDPDPQPIPGDVNTSETNKTSPKENPSGNINTKPAAKSDPGESSGINGIDIVPPAPMPDEKINRNDPAPDFRGTLGGQDVAITPVVPQFINTWVNSSGNQPTNYSFFDRYPVTNESINSIGYHKDFKWKGLPYDSLDANCADLMIDQGTIINSLLDGIVSWPNETITLTPHTVNGKTHQDPHCGYSLSIRSTVNIDGVKTEILISYSHMREQSPLRAGDKVTAGQQLGFSGNTGNSGGPHLHIQVSIKNVVGKWEAQTISDWFPRK